MSAVAEAILRNSEGEAVPLKEVTAVGRLDGLLFELSISRLAAAQRLIGLAEADARALAVQYQLVSPYTSLVVVAERAAQEKAANLPYLVAVPHMAVPVVDSDVCAPAAVDVALSLESYDMDFASYKAPEAAAAAESPLRRSSPHVASGPFHVAAADARVILDSLAQSLRDGHGLPTRIDLLAELGAPELAAILVHRRGDRGGRGRDHPGFLALLVEAVGADPEVTAAAAAPQVLGDRRHRNVRRTVGQRIELPRS